MIKLTRKLSLRFFPILTLFFTFYSTAFSQTVGVFYDNTLEPIKFAAADVQTALVKEGYTVEMLALSSLNDLYANKKIVIALASNIAINGILSNQGGSAPTGLGEQAYALRTTTQGQTSYWVLGGDVNGAMYGGLQIAENISFNGFSGTYNIQETPFMLNRGMKLNLPMDRRIPTYVGGWSSNSAKKAIPAVWDSTFWMTLIDQQARNRYNMLSVWVHHPFPALVKLADYPNACLPNIEGFDGYVNNMNHEQRVAFWRRIMQYAHSRGMSFYFFNWNVYIDYASTQYPGITKDKSNSTTRDYMYKSMQALIETYPDLDGFGISAGDGMGSSEGFTTNEERTAWTYDCFGKAVKDYLIANPDRKFNIIHRSIYTDFNLMSSVYQPLQEQPNASVNFSIKYAMAHMYSTPTPQWSTGEITNVAGAGGKTWITVRNDDYFYINWGDHQFVRDFMNGIPNRAAITGMYIGTDGYNPSRTYFCKDNTMNGQLEVERRWYMEMLWGRLSYNPQTSNDVFTKTMANRFPAENADNMFKAWTLASRSLPKVTELVMKNWQLDFHWWPEACWSDPGRCSGFRTITTAAGVTDLAKSGFDKTDVARGSNLCNIANSAAGNCSGKKSTYTLADEMEADASEALNLANEMSSDGNADLEMAITNIKQMAYLSRYYAYKIRGATFKVAGQTVKARDEMAKAYCSWMNYKNLMESTYYADDFRNISISPNWNFGDAAVLKEYTDLGGVGKPMCSDMNYFITLSVTGNIGGTVSGGGIVKNGDSLTVIATPIRGYKFDNWKENNVAVSTNANYTFIVSQDRQLTANFSLDGSCVLPYSYPGFTVVKNTVNWSSGPLNIECAQSVDIYVDIEGIGADNSDYCNVYYKVDGGSRIELSLNKAAFAKKTVSVTNINGSTVELILEVKNSFSDETYNVSNIRIVSPEKLSQEITFPLMPAKNVGDADLEPRATASSGLAVTYSSSNPDVANIENGKIHAVSPGTSTITTSQEGDSAFNPAPEVKQTLTITSGALPTCNLPWNGTNMDISNQTISNQLICNIDISCARGVTLSMDLEGAVGMDAVQDYLKIYYFVDGGTAINFLDYSGGNFSLYTKSVTDISGKSLQIFVSASTTSQTEHYQISNILVTSLPKFDQTITFPVIPEKKVGDSSFEPGATSSSKLPVSYESSNTEVATISDSKIHIVGAGTSVITASQAGDVTYNPAPEVSQILTTAYPVSPCVLPWNGNNIDISNQSISNQLLCNIDISCSSSVSISMDLEAGTGMDAGQDYLRIYYVVDEGTPIDILNYKGGDFSLYNKTVTGLNGNNLKVFVNAYTSTATKHFLVTNFVVREIELNDIHIAPEDYLVICPNPVSGILNLKFPDSLVNSYIKVFGSQGQIIYSTQTKESNLELDVKSMNLKGVLILQLTKGSTVSYHKIVVN